MKATRGNSRSVSLVIQGLCLRALCLGVNSSPSSGCWSSESTATTLACSKVGDGIMIYHDLVNLQESLSIGQSSIINQYKSVTFCQ